MHHHFKMQLEKALEIIRKLSHDTIGLNSAFVDQTLVAQWVKNHQLVSLPMKLDTPIDGEIVLKCLYNVLSMLKVHFGDELYNLVYNKLDYSRLLEGSPHIHEDSNWIELPEYQGKVEDNAMCPISLEPYGNLDEPVALVILRKRCRIVHVFEWKELLKCKDNGCYYDPTTREEFMLHHVHRLPKQKINPLPADVALSRPNCLRDLFFSYVFRQSPHLQHPRLLYSSP